MRRGLAYRTYLFLAVIAARTGRFIANSRPGRWVARQKTFRYAVGISARLWHLVACRVWLPSKRFIRRSRQYLGRREVWYWLITWAICAVIGVSLTTSEFVTMGVVLGALYVFLAITRPFEAFLVWIIVGPLAQVTAVDLGRLIPDISFDRIALTLILVCAVARKLISRSTRGSIDAVDLAIGAFTLVSTANLFLTRITSAGFATFSDMARAEETITTIQVYADHYVYAFATFYIVRNLVDEPRKIKLIMLAMVSVAIYLVPIGIFEHLTGITWFTETRALEWSDANRAAGPFKNPAVYGTVLGVCFIIAVHLYFQAVSGFKRLLYGGLLFSIGVGLVMTFTRAAWIGPASALLAMLFFYRAKRRVLLAWVMLGVIALVISFPAIQRSPLYTERITNRRQIDSRLVVTHNTINMIKDKPIFGCGVNNFDFYKNMYPVNLPGVEYSVGATSHNTFLTILAETGLVGFIPYTAALSILFFRWLITYIRMPKLPYVSDKELVATVGIATICYFVMAFAIDMRFFRYVEYLFWLLLALVLVLHRMYGLRPQQNERMIARKYEAAYSRGLSR